MFVQEEALASSLSSTDSLTPEDRPIARGCSDSLESIPSGQVTPFSFWGLLIAVDRVFCLQLSGSRTGLG